MFSAIRRRLHLSPAMVIAGLALVFAMSGGAYAAKKYLITSTKQISPSVLKQLQGKAGPGGVPGIAGSAGPVGPAGPAGSGGAKGETGSAGAQGAAGAAGAKGVTGATGAKGATGATGTTGFTDTLPPGKTETGTWGGSGAPTVEMGATIPISFPIPLKEGSTEAYRLTAEETQNHAGTHGCTGSVEHPTAPSGELCVYTAEEESEKANFSLLTLNRAAGYYPAGTTLSIFVNEGGYYYANGTFAVTAP